MPGSPMREQMVEEPCEEGPNYGTEDSPGIKRRSKSLGSIYGATKVQEVSVRLAIRRIA